MESSDGRQICSRCGEPFGRAPIPPHSGDTCSKCIKALYALRKDAKDESDLAIKLLRYGEVLSVDQLEKLEELQATNPDKTAFELLIENDFLKQAAVNSLQLAVSQLLHS